MEADGIEGDRGVRTENAVFQIDVEDGLSTRQEETAKASNILKSLSPLINTMRAFGLYFCRVPYVVQDSTSQPVHRCARERSNWNAGRIYATIMLAVMWLNAVQACYVFDGKEILGALLLNKIALIPGALVIAVLHTAYYVASHTRSLDRIFCQADLSVTELSSKYSRRAKVATFVCWLLIMPNVIMNAYLSFTYVNNTYLSIILAVTFRLSKLWVDVIKVVFIVLYLLALVSSAFPQAMNFMVMSFLYDQFTRLNEEFSKCVGDRGEFSGNFEQFRRRHQAVSRSVQEADRFLMISNVACFCCQIAGIILVLYTTIFFRQETVLPSVNQAFGHIFWLVINICVLCMAAGLAMVINHAVSVHNIYNFDDR